MRQQRTLADARLLERDQADVGVTRLGDGVGVGNPEPEVRRGPDQRPRTTAMPAPAASQRRRETASAQRVHARLAASSVRPVRPVEPRTKLRQDDGQQRDRGKCRDERDQHPAVAHRAQEGQRQSDQGEEADRDRYAAEDDRPPGGLHGTLDCRIAGEAATALLAPARDDDQRVVDRHPEAKQRDQELDDRRYRGQLGQPEQQQKGGQDGGDSHQERYQRQKRSEDERQHQECTKAADQGPIRTPGPSLPVPASS